MAQSPPPIALITRTFDSHSGVSRVAKDVLLALSRCSSELRVRAWIPRRLPTQVDGLELGPYRVEALPLGLVARAIGAGDAPPRSLLEHTRLALRSPSRSAAADALEVVNGLGAHALHERLSAVSRGRKPTAALMVHESPRHFEERGPDALAAAIAAISSYDYHVFVSDRGRAEWGSLANLDPARSWYIPNCVGEQAVDNVRARDRAQLRRQLGYDDHSVRLVCLGTVSPRKGHDLLLAALRQLETTQPQLRVDFLGQRDSPWAKQLVASVRGTPLAERVRFLGSVDDTYERIFAADALVLASRAEAFPLSVLEALALGTCVVAAGVDGITEQVVHAQSGLLFAREDLAACTEQLRQVAINPQLRAALATAGRERYLSHFTRSLQLARWTSAVAMMRARGV